jgi:predicted Zn finger-like uncharacterized protein
MNVRCPQCQSVFRVDPDRIPPNGIKARCSRCSTVFEMTRDGARSPASAGAPASVGVAPNAPATAAAPLRAEPAAPAPAPRPTLVETSPAPKPASAPAPAPVAAQVVRPLPERAQPAAQAPEPAAPTPPKRASFRNQDPSARAQRLARALVSDIVAYNKDKLKQTRGAAALRTEFREEIRKSWEEYVEQVGLDLAKNTPYFRDSLNELLANGEKVF